jgi:hypothetical protein
MSDHEKDGSGYAYCDRPHDGVTDEDRREWCRWYHRPEMPKEVPGE